jgi:myo-inositol-1(or 4)-monophosphatase
MAPPFTAMPRVRSLALRIAQVAHGACDVAFAGGNSHDWDLAAADLLVHEAGGALTSITGATVTYNRPVPRHGMLVAAGRDRHAPLIELLGDGRLAFS